MQEKIISCIICALIFAAVFIIDISKDVDAQVTEEWVVRYNGPENSQDRAMAMTLDRFGNIYVTGRVDVGDPTGGGDYCTIKYDNSGTELWISRYDGPIGGGDYPIDIAVGPSGNVYVTGASEKYAEFYGCDFATVAYDPNGNELWVARYDYVYDDQPCALAIDSSENVYVTGMSIEWRPIPGGGATDYDFATIKYDPLGNELWVARYNSPGNGDDKATAIALDPSGNVYVTGYGQAIGTYYDYITIAYDSDGNELWMVRYNGPGNNGDMATDIALDSSGNVYVTGGSDNDSDPYPDGNRDYTTIKYDSLGNQLWIARYNGLGDANDQVHALSIGSSGNVYVTGYSNGVGNLYYAHDYATVAYDSSGNELWVARYDGPESSVDRVSDIALDSSENVYVTGYSDGYVKNEDYATIKYDSSGNELWVQRYNGPGNNSDRSCAIAVDDLSKDVYVTGFSSGIGTFYGSFDWATIKYSQEGYVLQSAINIDPDTLSLKSKGKWITCYINLPAPYDINDIKIGTVMLEDIVPAEWGDIQNDTLMVKFDRSDMEDYIGVPQESVELTVTGELADGTQFSGSDTIRTILPGK